MKTFFFQSIRCACVCGALMQGQIFAAQEEQFSTPDDAVKALAAAAATKDTNALNAIFGPELHSLVSADPIQASNRFDMFARRISQKADLVPQSDDKDNLNIGYDAWPFPIPLVRHEGKWVFDTDAGREEILCRRIGANELGTIQVCHTYIDAQREYANEDRIGDGVLQYAQHLRSTPGKHDGLYWHAVAGEDMSPLGPLIAEAKGEGYHRTTKIMDTNESPYHGYLFKILTRQGKHAPGGKYNYIINGRMVAGFALVAWPAEWDNSGVMTFIVNQDGRIFEKNLGPRTAAIARRMTAFDPDSTWKPTREP